MTTATKDRLTQRQTLFVQAIATGKAHNEAAELAGYTGGNLSDIAYNLTTKPHVARAITLARERYIATRQWSVEWWRHEVMACIQAANASDDLPSRLRALELAGRHLGALEPTAPISPAAQTLLTMLAESMQRAQLPAPRVIEVENAQPVENAQAASGESAQ